MENPSDISYLKNQIRKKLRAQRALLTLEERTTAAEKITTQLKNMPFFKNALSIALYMPLHGEVETAFIRKLAYEKGKHCYLPRLTPPFLQFHATLPKTPLFPNQWGILEPPTNTLSLAAQKLDLVLLPLVAFDEKGNRLGMGGGYYDQTFAFKKNQASPLLVGLAYAFQQVNCVPHNELDVYLDAIITENQIWYR